MRIEGVEYIVEKRRGRDVDGYYTRGAIRPKVLFPPFYRYYIRIGESIIAVRKPVNVVSVVVAVVITLTCLAGMLIALDKMPTLPSPTILENDTIDNGTEVAKEGGVLGDLVILEYNKYMAFTNGVLDVRLKNGNHDGHVKIEAEGLNINSFDIKAGESIVTVPADYTSESDVIEGTLYYTYNDKCVQYQIMIENIDANAAPISNGAVTYEGEEVLHD